jgi:pseudaminic acid cytidylyltransferase|tara:strand:- start:32299 stop:33000 length:702 start_codon:yes stop_codon:yes gene_type:complete
MEPRKICIIPARGGSKRISKKNIKLFLGKEIIAYSIQSALNSKLFDEVIVSTDDSEIKKIAENYGANVPFMRSNKNSDDFSNTYDVIEEVLVEYKKLNKEFNFVCCLYACAPFVTSDKLKEGYNVLKQNSFDTVFPVMSFSFPIQRALKKDSNNKVSFVNPEYSLTRSQDLPLRYHDAGQFYWLNSEKLMISKKLISRNSGCIEISELEGQDIDNPSDWHLAEIKYEILQNIK